MTYRQWLRLLFAKGYKLETLEEEVPRLGFKRGFSKTSLSNKGKTDKPVPPKLVEYAWTTKLRGPQEDFESYARHLASVGVEVPAELADKFTIPPPPRVDPQEIAEGLTPKLEALLSPVGETLDSALSALAGKLDAVAASLRGKMDAFAMATESKLDSFDAKLGRIHAKADEHGHELSSAHLKLAMVDGSVASARRTLDGVKTTVDDTHAKVVAIHAKLDGHKREHRRLLAFGALAAVLASAVGCGAWFLLDKRRSHIEPRSAVLLVASPGPDGAVVSDPQEWLAKAVEEMGEKPRVPLNQPVPLKPFPGQKVPPCDSGLAQAEINGGCWFSSDAKPPCGRLFRSGDKCYLPVAADPKKPVGGTSGEPH